MTPVTPQHRAYLPASPATGTMDRYFRPAAGGSTGVGLREGSADTQCDLVISAQQETRLPPALSAQMRQMRVGYSRLLLPCTRRSAWQALLPLCGDGPADNGS
jgi:hypothetical protein